MEDVVEGHILIGGRLGAGRSGQWLESVNPADESLLGRVPRGGAEDVDDAVRAAAEAQRSWAARPIRDRSRVLRELIAALEERGEEIARIESLDTGNVISQMRGDVRKTVNQIDYFAGLGYEMKGDTVPSTMQHLHLTMRQPYGVVARIAPYNHPLMFAAARLAAPLMSGNAIVIKPPEQAPLSSTILAKICESVMPPGLVNIVTGLGPEVGAPLVRHRMVKRIGFQGGVETGRMVQAQAAEAGVKHVTLELGGKNPCLVFPDAPLEPAVQGALTGMNFGWQGQSCGSTSRLFVHRSQYEPAIALLREKTAEINVGDPLDEASQMGPLIDAGHYARVQRHIEKACAQGAEVVHGGRRPPEREGEPGFWMEPTVLGGVTREMDIFHEEVFGPVLGVSVWDDDEQLIADCNAVEYGLAASIWTGDLKTAIETAKRLDAGYIWINGSSAHYLGCGFGGMKESGLGREESLEELLSYTEQKAIHVHL